MTKREERSLISKYKEHAVNGICKLFRETKIVPLKAKIQEQVDKCFYSTLSKEWVEVIQSIRPLLAGEYCITISDLNNRDARRMIRIPLKFTEKTHPKFWQLLNKNKTLIALINEEYALNIELYNLPEQIRCILKNMESLDQLKNEFPEAYNIIYPLIKPKCDDVENIRAKLK